jgi:anti-repressor protein
LEPAANSWQTLAAADGDFSVADAAKILGRDPASSWAGIGCSRCSTSTGGRTVQLADDRPRVDAGRDRAAVAVGAAAVHYHPRSGELVMDAPQVRVTVKGLHELHKRLGGSAVVAIPTVPMQGGAR